MPAQTRVSVPSSRVYNSTPAQEQIKFPSRKKLITYRHSMGNTRAARQETLTQMDFVNLEIPVDDEEELDNVEYEAQEMKRKKKRRRTEGDEKTTISHHTQTLTQFDFMSTPIPPKDFTGMDDERSSIDDSPARGSSNSTTPLVMGPPRTPSRRRIFEIPSSQSPFTPPSTRSTRATKYQRSPLTERSINTVTQSPLPVIPLHASLKPPKLEIQDTFECDEEYQQTRILSTPVKVSRVVRFASNASTEPSPMEPILPEIEDSEAESDEESETCYDDLGPETQVEVDRILSTSEKTSALKFSHEGSDLEEPALPTLKQHLSQFATSEYTQTQRLSTQQVESMAPRSLHSDIFISIHPAPMEAILNRTKDHEFRNYRIPDMVSRMWFYETKPASRVKYMASISGAKQPGGIDNLNGTGNAEFNVSTTSGQYAYEILQIYELADPIRLETLKVNGWLDAPPRKYNWVRPAVLNALMANLKYSLFSYPACEQSSQVAPLISSDSQEADEQLLSTIKQFTQRQSSQCHLSQRELQPQSTQAYPPPRPSQASTMDLTQVSNWNINMRNEMQDDTEDEDYDAEPQHSLIPESPSALHPITSSPSLPRIQAAACHDPRLPLFMSSSQLLTRSQMLPESLLDDSVPSPPDFVDDTEDDDDDEL